MEPALPYCVIERLLTIITVLSGHIYWAKVLTDHPKNCDNCFVVQYFGLNFGTINENTNWHQSYTSAGIWHSACSLRMRIHIKPLKCTCNSRNDLNLNSNHGNLNNNVFFVKMIINWSDKLTHNCQNIWRKTILKNGGWQCFRRGLCYSVKLTIVIHLLPSQLIENE